jgi:transcriptional regulator with XRE-family HTH domain
MVVAFDDLHCRKALDTKKRMISKKQKPVAALGDPSDSRQELQVGLRLRHQRMSLRMTLRDLADQAGCSESMLSKVENGRALPSLTTLHRICQVLGLTVSRLLSKSGEPPGVVARAGERPVTNVQAVRPNSGIKVEQLIPVDPANLLEGNILLIAPGSGADQLITHPGEEVGYVLEGTLEVTVGPETYTVSVGDSVYYRSELPHGFFNPGPESARVLMISTPPTF